MIAAEFELWCRPVHLLATLSELAGPIGAVLMTPDGRPLLEPPLNPPEVHGGGASYLCSQTQGAVNALADRLGQPHAPEHLLLAVIDQADPEAMDALDNAGIDRPKARETALGLMGQPLDLPRIEIPPLVPAGFEDRPILDEDDLDPTAWEALTWRQNHLPLGALEHPADWRCLQRLEAGAAKRIHQNLHLDADQELSLGRHHLRRVQQLAHDARPHVVPAPDPPQPADRFIAPRRLRQGDPHFRPHRRLPRSLSFMIGWGTWFGNRWSRMAGRWEGLQTRRFSYRTRASYRRP